MALWMQPGSEPATEEEKADLAAITAIRESSAVEFKEQGNEYLKMGKNHYKDALDCYTRAIDQKSSNVLHNSICYSNRAQVHLLLGNNRRALMDAGEAIKANDSNLKAYFRGAKAALALGLLPEASQYCNRGLQLDSTNHELERLGDKVEKMHAEEVARSKRTTVAQSAAEALVLALESRKQRVGSSGYKQPSRSCKPWLDSSGMLHWPVLLLYPETMETDFIEDFWETDMFCTQLDLMFGKDAPQLAWDWRHDYTRDRVELYYQANIGPTLSRKQLLQHFLEDGFEPDDVGDPDTQEKYWVKVDERETLSTVLSHSDHVVPGIPVFYAVASNSKFFHCFLNGEWFHP